METICECCAGIDVHKEFVQVCVRVSALGVPAQEEIRRYGTMTRELLSLSDWLTASGVTQVAMESTGVLWKPVYNILAELFEVLLVNAQHFRTVPGRKSDVRDCQWLAQLLACGLLKGSFVPPRPIRELRDLTRHRTQLLHEVTRVKNRVHKVLEDANIKLSSVASDIFGVSGRAILEAVIHGESNPETLAALARGRLRAKEETLLAALEGNLHGHHRFVLETLWMHLRGLEHLVKRLEDRIAEVCANPELNSKPPSSGSGASAGEPQPPAEGGPAPFTDAVDLLDSIPGVDIVMAQTVLAETGPDMTRFPQAANLASWAGLCPGSHESAGKRKHTHTTKGNRWLRAALTQAAWGATRAKDTYLRALYQRIARRRGKKRAIVAVAHTLLTIIYHMLTRGMYYYELGAGYFDDLDRIRLRTYHVKRLESLGFTVTLAQPA